MVNGQLSSIISAMFDKLNQMVSYNREINLNKGPGYKQQEVLQKLQKKIIKATQHIFDVLLNSRHFPNHWKMIQISIIAKPGKNSKKKWYSSNSLKVF